MNPSADSALEDAYKKWCRENLYENEEEMKNASIEKILNNPRSVTRGTFISIYKAALASRIEGPSETRPNEHKYVPFDHPCRKTCSGWQSGFNRGYEYRQAEERMTSPSQLENSSQLRITAPTLTWDMVEPLLPDVQKSFDEWSRLRETRGYKSEGYIHSHFYHWLRDEMKRKCEEIK